MPVEVPLQCTNMRCRMRRHCEHYLVPGGWVIKHSGEVIDQCHHFKAVNGNKEALPLREADARNK